jgi:hypothetical protein
VKWRKETPYNLISECGRFRIAKYDTNRGWVYALNTIGEKANVFVGGLDECKAKAREVGK